jgi:hypothetical protein
MDGVEHGDVVMTSSEMISRLPALADIPNARINTARIERGGARWSFSTTSADGDSGNFSPQS